MNTVTDTTTVLFNPYYLRVKNCILRAFKFTVSEKWRLVKEMGSVGLCVLTFLATALKVVTAGTMS